MKLAMAQMRMGTSVDENLAQTLRFIERAGKGSAGPHLFPGSPALPFLSPI